MSKIRIINEHHEIVPLMGKQLIAGENIQRFNNTVLHFDSHSDVGHIKTPKALNPNFPDELETILSQLNIGNPFTLLFFYGLIKDFYWFCPGETCEEIAQPFIFTVEHEWDSPLHFYKRKLTSCLDEIFSSRTLDASFYRKISIDSEENISYVLNSIDYALIDTGLKQLVSTDKEYVLDICLDYFYSNPDHRASPLSIVVTEEYYQEFMHNPLHPIKLKMGPLARAYKDKSEYKLEIGGFEQIDIDDANIMGKIIEEINMRFYFFDKFLRSLKGTPASIYVCRSDISNYTPKLYIDYIEDKLLALLSSLFQAEVIDETTIV